MTSKWVRMVAAQREYDVQWRFISLRLLNAHVDYDHHFPPEYEAGHTAGLKLLRVCAQAQADHGQQAVGPLYRALGTRVWDTGQISTADLLQEDPHALLDPILTAVALPTSLVTALEDSSWDVLIQQETDTALSLTGKDVGTPILHFQPPGGVAFFGPVISRLPEPDRAVELWDHVVGLAAFPGFAELKRSLRELPQLAALGVSAGEARQAGGLARRQPSAQEIGGVVSSPQLPALGGDCTRR